MNDRIRGEGQLGTCTGIVNTASMATIFSALAIFVSGDGQLDAIFKHTLTIVGQTAAIVAGDVNGCAGFY